MRNLWRYSWLMQTIAKASTIVFTALLAVLLHACGIRNSLPSTSTLKPTFVSTNASMPQLTSIATRTAAPTVEEQSTFVILTDEEAQAISNRLPPLDTQLQKHIPLPTLLQDAGINTARLRVIDRYIGNCLDTVTYELSKSYVLIIDDNACFGARVIVTNKGSKYP